ncbi:MAG: redoxin domain-containing protein [Pirellulales bacterium]|nr:redoxin domain-containing protein [Pirellulales bacterium]
MPKFFWKWIPLAGFVGMIVMVLATLLTAAPPKPAEALALQPIQPHVEYDLPEKSEIPNCTVRVDTFGGGPAWFVRNPQGQLLRRFADSNADNVVDQWSYFQDGLEVYRDIDSNYNGRADQCRWFHTAGTRWGVDDNEDGTIDLWRRISPQEVAEELVKAVRARDVRRFAILLPTDEEFVALGLGENQASQVAAQLKTARQRFRNAMSNQKVVLPSTNYLEFGAARPSTAPVGTNGSSKEVTVYENVYALVETNGSHNQLYLGTLIAVDEGWRLLDIPPFDGSSPSVGFSLTALDSNKIGGHRSGNVPSEEMTELMEKLQQLDMEASRLPLDRQGPLTDQRAEVLTRLAEVTTDPEFRNEWYKQLADMLSAAVQSGGYDQGVDQLEKLEQDLQTSGLGDELVAHVRFRRMLAEYMKSQQQPEADLAKIQAVWLEDLETFANDFPTSVDAAEAQLQLGMSHEFVGQESQAEIWYRQITERFPQTDHAEKARGALRRLASEGKPLRLKGAGLQGGEIDVAKYRGKLVLIQYWATWCEPCKQDMLAIKDSYTKHGGRGFDVIGICLDDDQRGAQQFIKENRIPWQQIYEPDGLNGRLADEMGVMTLPLMVLVDENGLVVNRNIHAAELAAEIKRRL